MILGAIVVPGAVHLPIEDNGTGKEEEEEEARGAVAEGAVVVAAAGVALRAPPTTPRPRPSHVTKPSHLGKLRLGW